jgi:UPF0755 protein
MVKRKKSEKVKSARWIVISVTVAVLILGGVIYEFYNYVFSPNVMVTLPENEFVFIPTGAGIDDVQHILFSHGIIKNKASFRWVSERMNYHEAVKAGKYRIRNGMSNQELVKLLRSGKQEPVLLVFNNIRNRYDFVSRIASQIEADSLSILKLLDDEDFVQSIHPDLSSESVMTLFIPNTYEFYWNTSAVEFIQRMIKEYYSFWDAGRSDKAENMGFNKRDVSILASIVNQETKKTDEMARIAGVYLNRMRDNWKLEADPTLIFALDRQDIRRVLNVHKAINSPYNTYKHFGLPPGPICIPSIAAIEGVLNSEKHAYYFFCAREDFSGYHSFARSYDQHLVNARKFQRELDRRNIKS